jgi:uncharacterized membrane protein
MNGTLKIVHLMCACLFLGNVIVSGVWAAMAERTRNHAVVQFSNRMVLITDLLFTLTGALGVVITGHLMAVRYGGDTAHPWLTWSYALFGLSGLIWLLVLVPIQLKQRQMLRRTDPRQFALALGVSHSAVRQIWPMAKPESEEEA